MPVASWSLTASSNATADASINWQEGQNPSTVNDSARAMMAATKAAFNDLGGVSALGGSGNTFTLALSQTLPSMVNGVTVGFIATRSNTGAVTLNVDSRGAKPLRAVSGVALASGQIVSGAYYICTYYLSADEWLISGNGTVTNAQLSPMAANTVKANLTGGSASPTDATLAALAAALAPLIGMYPSLIAMWSGTIATIPSGWVLCDGSNGTPDLRDKFVIGARQDSSGAKTNVTGALTSSGGSKDAIAVTHSHTATSVVTDTGHSHTSPTFTGGFANTGRASPGQTNSGTPITSSTETTGVTVATTVNSAGSSGTNANLPPYYALAFIMKT